MRVKVITQSQNMRKIEIEKEKLIFCLNVNQNIAKQKK